MNTIERIITKSGQLYYNQSLQPTLIEYIRNRSEFIPHIQQVMVHNMKGYFRYMYIYPFIWKNPPHHSFF